MLLPRFWLYVTHNSLYAVLIDPPSPPPDFLTSGDSGILASAWYTADNSEKETDMDQEKANALRDGGLILAGWLGAGGGLEGGGLSHGMNSRP